MATINTYLNFNGNTEDVFNFYRSVFGGEFAMLQRLKDAPQADKLSENDKEKILHIALPIGGNVLMGTDVLDTMHQVKFGTNSSICIHTESEDEARKFFDGLSAGGNVGMPLEKMFWGALFGMFTDKFGVQWMVSFDTQNQH
ncbi:MAG: VOC family protein [Chitinophagaceae bacterium]|nr:VOC family protein [Chitinophagaceae bacterium]